MYLKSHSIVAKILVPMLAFPCVAEDDVEVLDQTEKTNLVTNSTFSLTDEETIFIHDWENLLHINTKNKKLLDETSFFIEKCLIVDDDLKRHSYGKRYIKNSLVTYDRNKNIEIEISEKWSLMPTAVSGRTVLSQSAWMTSVGIGALFYSTQSSEAQVIHVDITKPMTSGVNASGAEFRITTKHSF